MVTLCGGTNRFGAGVGVPLEGGDELGHLLVALDAAEGSLGVEHAGCGPAQYHLPVAPTGYQWGIRRQGSVRKMFASTRASPASDFLRETEYRSR